MFKYSMCLQRLNYKFIKRQENFLCEKNINNEFIRLFHYFLMGLETRVEEIRNIFLRDIFLICFPGIRVC